MKELHLCDLSVSFQLLTSNLEQVGEKDDGFCSFASIGPQPKQWTCEQPAQAEGRQTQTQKVGRSLQNLQVPPDRRQYDS